MSGAGSGIILAFSGQIDKHMQHMLLLIFMNSKLYIGFVSDDSWMKDILETRRHKSLGHERFCVQVLSS